MKASLGAQVVLGATLFTTPGLKGGGQIPGAMGILTALLVILLPLLFYQRGLRRRPPGPDPGDGWGNGPEPPDAPRRDGPRGGIPLDDAQQARVRLRGRDRLSDMLPSRQRRPAREPSPERRPAPRRERAPN
jgi:hypothetical protein